MTRIKPFPCILPATTLVSKIAALPYDVYSSSEARQIVQENPLSFLAIDRPESQCPDDMDIYDPAVYEQAKKTLWSALDEGRFCHTANPYYYIYQLSSGSHKQTGLVGCASIDDYINQTIKKHENTRADKAADRIRHIDSCNAQTGPIFLTYRDQKKLTILLQYLTQTLSSLFHFTSDDGIIHEIWQITKQSTIEEIQNCTQSITQLYIADGHHRAAAAVDVGLKLRNSNKNHNGTENYNYFLSVLFPDTQLHIMDYNRVVSDLNGHDKGTFLAMLSKDFFIETKGRAAYSPCKKNQWGMYLDKIWYTLTLRSPIPSTGPVDSLDVSILQEQILKPLLGICDPRKDSRIGFVGGVRGLSELEDRVDSYGGVAFSMFPTSLEELFCVADRGLLMPPKSTWFEPKLRSGLFIHPINKQETLHE